MPDVRGYRVPTAEEIATVNRLKEAEERLLREIDDLRGDATIDFRWLNIAETALQQGFMALNRAVFRPQRIALPEDEAA